MPFDIDKEMAIAREVTAELKEYVHQVVGERLGREAVLRPLLHHRFGQDTRIPALVERLAADYPEDCVQQIEDAKTVDELLALYN